jgi:low affinity Fe/Cu permease
MKKEIPKIYVNKIDKINNNEEVFYSYKDKHIEQIDNINTFDIQSKIDELFRSNDFIYKKKVHIKTKYDEGDYEIISRSYDYLLTINGEKIYIQNIIEIR